jgi:bleomycin hydrolase
MIKRYFYILLLLMLVGCSRQQTTYIHDVLLPMTPVKDQGQTQICWAYAMLATIETEHILRGDSVNLSGIYVARIENRRAMCQTLLNIIQREGIVPYDVLPDDTPADVKAPKWVFMLGARYTPKEFAHSVCAPDEYLSLTSLPDSPYYNKVEVSIADNWEHNHFLNLPIDTLRRHVDEALNHRHPVCWESRKHAMEIVGLAHDAEQHTYYIMKNSWGQDQPHEGLVYMPVDQMWADMIAVYMTREAFATCSASK